MAIINVMDASTGQIDVEDTADVTVASVQGLTMLTATPPEFSHVILLPAANGMVKAGSISHPAILADAIAAVDTARSDLVTMITSSISTLTTSKMDKPTGSTSQYLRGDGSLATLPAADLSTTSKRANFTALSTMAALSVTDSATTSPTNAPTDAITNYNTVTTLLGLLVSAVNDANTKQNAIGTNANAIAANVNYLKTAVDGILTYLGLVPTSFNNMRTAGAAA